MSNRLKQQKQHCTQIQMQNDIYNNSTMLMSSCLVQFAQRWEPREREKHNVYYSIHIDYSIY